MIGKDLGYLMLPRTFLFWTVPRWLYDCVYSKAYTEILYADDTVTRYGGRKKPEKSAEERVRETMRKWNERKKTGKKVSLTNDYLNKQKQ